MRIISKQKDYYDFSMAYGVDSSICYNRSPRSAYIREFKTSFAKFGPMRFTTGQKDGRNRPLYGVKISSVIGGKLINLYYDDPNNFSSIRDKPERHQTDIFGIRSEVETLDEDADYTWVNELLCDPVVVFGVEMVHPWRDYFCNQDTTVVTDIKVESNTITIGAPILHLMGMQNYVEGLVIWTLIENFLTSDRKPMPEFSDKTKIISAGFDLKQSFRHRK